MKTFLITAVLLLSTIAFANTNLDVPNERVGAVLRIPIFESEEARAEANEQLAWSSGNQRFCSAAELNNCFRRCNDTTAYNAGSFGGRPTFSTPNECSHLCFVASGCRYATE